MTTPILPLGILFGTRSTMTACWFRHLAMKKSKWRLFVLKTIKRQVLVAFPLTGVGWVHAPAYLQNKCPITCVLCPVLSCANYMGSVNDWSHSLKHWLAVISAASDLTSPPSARSSHYAKSCKRHTKYNSTKTKFLLTVMLPSITRWGIMFSPRCLSSVHLRSW